MRAFTPPYFIVMTSLFILVFANLSFFTHVLEQYPLNSENIWFLLSLALVLYALHVIMFTLVYSKYLLKPILILALIIAAAVHYFMQNYNIVMDKTMIENIVQTDMNESLDLMSIQLFITLFLLAFIPSLIIYKIPLHYRGFKAELFSKVKMILLHLVLVVILVVTFSKFYTSFIREHKPLRLYANPIAAIYNAVAYVAQQFEAHNVPMKIIGEDATIPVTEDKKRKIVVMVVGEAARADHFSLNGYEKETNPLLKKEDIINFPQMYSCGTTTSVSVPCMFSVYGRSAYNSKKGRNTHNVLDILSRAGVDVLWRENNSDSKGVAVRLPYEYYKSSTLNTMCEGECRDEGMLVGLDEVLSRNNKDIIIVLHQMGNHGPAYYRRYPEAFKIFTPECKTNQLEACSNEEIRNAYDNALRYTDYFLSKVIALLKNYEDAQTAMIYIADHGESLGENGLYLHGLPYFMAPDHQKHVGAVMWFGENFPVEKNALKQKAVRTYSHDNLFSTLLGLFNVQTKVYEKNMDILAQ